MNFADSGGATLQAPSELVGSLPRTSERHVMRIILLLLMIILSVAKSNAQDARANPSDTGALPYERTWQLGATFMGGYPPYYEIHGPIAHYFKSSYYYSGGFEVGRSITMVHGPGFLRGHAEAMLEIFPYWQEYSPAQLFTVHLADGGTFIAGVTAYNIHGVAATPALVRWNLARRESGCSMWWAQAGGGLLWTSLEFPQGDGAIPHGHTSRINFTPQVAFGDNIFLKKSQSLNFGVHAIHISNAGLGDIDPGVNVLVQASIGYSWWK